MARYIIKNEFRMDLNRNHYGRNKKPHPAYISAESGHFYKANNITHSLFLSNGKLTRRIEENPNKNINQKRYKTYSRISPPYWQHKNLFSKNTLNNYNYSKYSMHRINSYNKNYR